jgi:hypothetical protein
MKSKIIFFSIVLIAVLLDLAACASTPTPVPTPIPTITPGPSPTSPVPGGPGGAAIVNSDSIVTGKIIAIRPQTTGYPWELDVLIQNSVDVGNLPNPTKDNVGKVITVKTDQDMNVYKVNDMVTARVKYVGDVPKPGITLYMYNFVPLAAP